MQSKSKILITIAVLAFTVLLIIAYGTNILRYYKNSTFANHPTLPVGSRMLVSSLVQPKKMDFMAFKHQDSIFGGKYIFRLVGIPGDTILLRKGNLFINNTDADAELSLAYSYILPLGKAKEVEADLLPIDQDGIKFYKVSQDSVIAYTTKVVAIKNNLYNFRVINKEQHFNKDIFSVYGKEWNKDFFGPLVLKDDEYFVLGDNRDNAYDSRYIGPVKKNQIIGKAIKF